MTESMNIDREVRRILAKREAERQTPRVVYRLDGRRGAPLGTNGLGAFETFEMDGQAEVRVGLTSYDASDGLDLLRLPTAADAAAMEAAEENIREAHRAAQVIYAAAFRRGRRPTLEELREATARAHALAGSACGQRR